LSIKKNGTCFCKHQAFETSRWQRVARSRARWMDTCKWELCCSVAALHTSRLLKILGEIVWPKSLDERCLHLERQTNHCIPLSLALCGIDAQHAMALPKYAARWLLFIFTIQYKHFIQFGVESDGPTPCAQDTQLHDTRNFIQFGGDRLME